MAWYVTAGIANVSTSAVLFLLSLLKKNKTSADGIFVWFCGAIFQFTLFHLLWQTSKDFSVGAFFGRYLMIGPIFIPILFFHYILKVNGGGLFDKHLIKWGYFLTAVLAVSLPTRFFIARIEPQRWFPYWTIPGPLLHIHVASYFIFIACSIFLLRDRLKSIIGLGKEQARYLFTGAVLGFGGGGMNYLAFYNLPVKPYGHILIFIGEAIVGYAVLRYRLADLNSVLRQALGYLFFSAILAFPSAVTLSIVRPSPVLTFSVVFLLVGFLGPWSFEKLRGGLFHAIDLLPPFKERFFRFRNIGEILRGLDEVNSIGEWINNVVEFVRKLYSVQSANLLVRDESQGGFIIRASFGLTVGEQRLLWLPMNSPLVERFKERTGVLVAELAQEAFNTGRVAEAKSDLAFIHGDVSVPLFYGGDIFAILNVGPKLNGEMFTDLDLAYLGNLAGTAEHRLQVILSGVSREHQTAAWAHDLSKPFGEKGSLGDIKALAEGKCGLIDEDSRQLLSRIADEMTFVKNNLRALINGKESSSGPRLQEMKIPFQRVQSRFLKVALEKGIRFLIHNPDPDLSAFCDVELLEHRVLGNLVENAIRHTPKGGTVEVGYRIEGETFVGYVKDTGPGIKQEDIPRLFTPGTQLDPQNKGLAGLGLASVKSVIDAHGGRVWVESEVGKGTTFYFSLKGD